MLYPDRPYFEHNTLYAGTSDGVFRFDDAGNKWLEDDKLIKVDVRGLAINQKRDLLYAGIYGLGVYLSNNGGQSWQEFNTGLIDLSVQILALDPRAGTPFVGTTTGVFKYNGAWQQVDPSFTAPITALVIDPDDGTLYVGTSGAGVFRYITVDKDAIWQQVGTNLPSQYQVTTLVLNTDKNSLYAGTGGDGVFRLPDLGPGTNWQATSAGLTNKDVRALLLNEHDGTLYIATAGGVFHSIDQGDNWGLISQGLTNLDIFPLTLDAQNNTLYAGTGDGQVFRSTDQGQLWQPVDDQLGEVKVWSLALRPEPSRLTISNTALDELWASHPAEEGGKRYPWRLSLSSLTGLPVFLRVWLDTPLQVTDNEIVSPPITRLLNLEQLQAIFGLPENQLYEVLDKEIIPGPIIRLTGPTNDKGTTIDLPICHLTWYQLYPGQERAYPIIGGSVQLHGVINDRRAAATSSYFPLSANYAFSPDEGGFKNKPDTPPMEPALKVVTRVIDATLQLQDLKLTAPLEQTLQSTIVPIRVDDKNTLPLEGILPFEGSYYLVNQVRVSVPGQDPWFTYVDAYSGQTLGDPWQTLLPAPATYYQTSTEAKPGGNPTGSVSAFLNQAPPNQPTMQQLNGELASHVSGLNNLLSASTNTETTVGVQALRLYAYLRRTCGVLSNSIPGTASPVAVLFINPDDNLMGFNYDSIQFPEIRFWRDDQGTGITLPNVPKIYTPAQDPEVALHEFTHALLWQLNGDPWDSQAMLLLNPFGRALHEGYAMYLPRSLVASDKLVTPNDGAEFAQAWARAAYRDWINNPPDWVESWVFPRSAANQVTPKPGDYLPVPNTYPAGKFSIEDAKGYYLTYEVGMVWGRALADLRTILGNRRTDWLAVQSYFYLHGHIANFELAAEGLLDADLKLNNETQLANGSQPIWAGRGIAAGQGVYGFDLTVPAGSLIAASDAGVLLSPDRGATWKRDNKPLSNLPQYTLAGVTAVAATGTTLYAAAALPPASSVGTPTGWRPNIYSRQINDATWNPVGDWSSETDNAIPSSLLWVNNQLIVGTNRGVYFLQNQQWQKVGQGNSEFVAVDIAPLTLNVGVSRLAACLPNSLRQIRLDNPVSKDWGLQSNLFNNSDLVRPTAMITWQHPTNPTTNGTYVGTLADGLWQIPVATTLSTLPVYDDSIGAVLAMAINNDKTKLYVATDKNILELTAGQTPPHPPKILDSQTLIAAGAKVISLIVTDDNQFLLAGTLAHGIWRCDVNQPNSWEQRDRPAGLPNNLTLHPEEQALLSFVHTADLSPTYQITNLLNNVQVKLAKPTLPLTIVQPDPGGYTLAPGPVILSLKNTDPIGASDTILNIQLVSGPLNNVINIS